MRQDYIYSALSFILTYFLCGSEAVCPENWVERNSRCYYFSHDKAVYLPWHEAQAQCERMGANLVVITDDSENAYIWAQTNEDNTWTGLHDLQQYDAWEWVDGTPLTYTNWLDGQPDHWDNAPGGTEDCVSLNKGSDGLWNDMGCVIPAAYVCERGNDLDTIARCDSKNGWQELYNGRCYKFVSDLVPWTTANQACKDMGAELAAITTDAEQRAISVEINSRSKLTWIGLSTVNHVNNELYWSNEVDSFSSSSYKHWDDDEPSITETTACTEMVPDANNYAPWKTERCGEERSYICETGLTGSCADGWRLSSGSCYLYVVAENAWLTWTSARDECKSMGANILVIETEAEQQYISQQLPEFLDAGASELWLGISDGDEDGVFKWENDEKTPVAQGEYTNWNKNQPLERPGAWDCVQIYTNFYLGRWETEDCFASRPFMCEIAPGVTPKPVIPVANLHSGCDPDWLWYNNYCYYFSYNALDWTTSEGKCRDMDSHLTSILTGDEHGFIVDHVNENTWAGGHAIKDVVNFEWSDQSPWSYENWAEGEPNNVNQGCLQLWKDAGYYWDDVACETLLNYVCKKHEQDCWYPLGMESRSIKDDEISASSQWDENHAPYLGRLNNDRDGDSIGAWSSSGDDRTPGEVWFQVHLRPKRTVFGITTQGRPRDYAQWITKYKVAYSNDGTSWTIIQSSGQDKVFIGNADTSSKVTNRLPKQIVASYIRLIMMEWFDSPTLRMELLGCDSDGSGDLTTPPPDTDCTSVSYESRLDCGFNGITPAECQSKGCCYDNSVPDTISCFYKKGDFDSRCGKDWIYDPGGQLYCYHFNPYLIRDRTDAQLYCYSKGGDLLSIHSQQEQSYVTAHVTGLVSASALWIGVNRLDPNEGWQWSDTTPYNFKYWQSGEPNDWTGEEECVEMYTTTGTWNDNPCYYQRGVACKKGVNDFPVTVDDGNIVVQICEGDKGTLICGGNEVILVHHASYGRTNSFTCGEGDVVPADGCHSTDSLQIVSDMCNGQPTCKITASNEIFGDPCYETYKYLSVIYSCETITCLEPLGMENGTIPDTMISESTKLDGSHGGNNARLNGATSWATNEGLGAWLQILFPKHMRISGLLVQGAKDADRWVTSFKMSFSLDDTNSQWTIYENFDNNEMVFEGSSDRNTIKQVVFAEKVFTTGIRILPQEWKGNMLGMRIEVLGCNPFQEVTCGTTGDEVFLNNDGLGTVKNLDCPSFCPEIVGYNYELYGNKIYSGNSQVCVAAIHSGALLDNLGGAVTVKLEEGQSSYKGTERNGVHSQDLDQFSAVAFSFTSEDKNCDTGWIPYDQYCYKVYSDEVPWTSAEAACILQDAHVASIANSVESDFVWQVAVLSGVRSLWIGLNSIASLNEYVWSDSYPVTYTYWGYKQPNRNSQSCVMLKNDTGTWDDDVCDTPRPFVCKRYKGYYQHDSSIVPTPPPGCQEGWVPYEDKCFLFQRESKSYTDAKNLCTAKLQGSVPIEITDKYMQSFLHTVIGAEDFRWWLGMTGTPSVGGSTWQWESSNPVDYDNWGKGSPDISKGECAVFYGGPFGTGLWYSYSCEREAYPICQIERDGYTSPPKVTPAPSGGCPGGWVPEDSGGWCYRAYLISDDDAHGAVGWSNALQQCLATGGDLLSIHSSDEERFILSLLDTKLGKISTGLWIGLNNKASASQLIEDGWEWSDQSAVSYTSWNQGYPKNSKADNCVELRYEQNARSSKWTNIDCDQTREFICKLKQGLTAMTPTVPPVGKPNSNCKPSSFQETGTWLEYNEWCYFFNDLGVESWHSAEEKCLSAGGHLVSLHEHNEQSFITNQLKAMTGTIRFWIGLYERGGVDGEYYWSDGTPVEYVNWMPGEPNDSNGMEQCVDIIMQEGRWNDANCGLEFGGYICKKRLGDAPVSPAPTNPWPGGCPSNWLAYDNYCYKIQGEYTNCATDADHWNDLECRAPWYDARQMCRDMDGDLVTIHNKYENAFVGAQILRLATNAWIGMSDEQWWNKYHWSTGEQVTYTNWYTNEPNHSEGEERCVEMYHYETRVGRWNDNRCDNAISYVCQKKKDSSISPGQEINNNRGCPNGWMQYDTVNGNYICYYLDMSMRSFTDAQSNCQKMRSGANLASVQTMYEQAFITSYVKDQTAWLGLQLDQDEDEDSNTWKWIDQWPVWVTNWGEQEPSTDPVKQCILNKDSLHGSSWVTEDCSAKHPSVCRWTTESVPPTPGTIVGSCPSNDWQEYGGFCFRAHPSNGDELKQFTWGDAEAKCIEHFGQLVSFGSRSQVEWVISWLNTTEPLWIGLRDNEEGGWSWSDNRPFTYTNWNSGEPNDWGEFGEDCGEMYPDGKWNDNACDTKRGYICRVPKAVGTDENGNIIHFNTPTPPQQPINSNAGVIAGAVIGSIAAVILIAALGYYVYTKDLLKMKSTGSSAGVGFENPQYVARATESKGFDDIGASNA